MKNSVVKKTFLDSFLNMILPYFCRGCGKTGNLLCDSCKSDIKIVGLVRREGRGDKEQEILTDVKWAALACNRKIKLGEVEELYIGGIRKGVVRRLVEDYKFGSVKKIAEILAAMIDEAIPEEMPGEIVIVPLPTVCKHIRQRGFDHAWRLAEELGKQRGWPVEAVLVRVNKTVQVGADEEMRLKQAEKAYVVDTTKIEPSKTYLLLDDVWTTGASMRAAAEKLRAAGAERIIAGVVSLSL